MITNIEVKRIAHETAIELAKILGKKQEKAPEEEQQWLTCKEAAAFLGVTPAYLRRIKDNFPHSKSGDKSQGQLRFFKEGLKEKYINKPSVSKSEKGEV